MTNEVYKWPIQSRRKKREPAAPECLKRPPPSVLPGANKRQKPSAASPATLLGPTRAADRVAVKGSEHLHTLAQRLATGRTDAVLLQILHANPFKKTLLDKPPSITGRVR